MSNNLNFLKMFTRMKQAQGKTVPPVLQKFLNGGQTTTPGLPPTATPATTMAMDPAQPAVPMAPVPPKLPPIPAQMDPMAAAETDPYSAAPTTRKRALPGLGGGMYPWLR